MAAHIRVDLHCHSEASNRAGEAALRAIRCPECYSLPGEVYAQAKQSGMDFVALTDHDAMVGAEQLAAAYPGEIIVGEEVTCWFADDRCKLHLLVFGHTPEQHAEIQARANDVVAVAQYLAEHEIAHSVAHPLYRQNDRLEPHHLEKLLVLFKGFECLNGSHSSLHREALEPILDALSASEILRLARKHNLVPLWDEPWVKARTGGSDDHGLLNIGRTWTEFPAGTKTVAECLEHLRRGRTRAGGEAGSAAKLAHAFYGVGVRYYSRHVLGEGRSPNLPTMLLQVLAGVRPKPSRWEVLKLGARHGVRRLGRRIAAPFAAGGRGGGTGLIRSLFVTSARRRFADHGPLLTALNAGRAPLGEHAEMFKLVSDINSDVTRGIAGAIRGSIGEASFTRLFDSISAVLAQQFVLAPYYFAVFHQNKERDLLRRITGQRQGKVDAPLKIALFTDTLDETNGVARFVRTMATCAERGGRQLTVATCAPGVKVDAPWRVNFDPTLTMPMPYYPDQPVTLPPLLEILEWADRQQFDAVHCSTPGPMGMAGWVVAKMLRVPMVATYHTDFPAYARDLSGDHRVEAGTTQFMRWFHAQAAVTFTRSRAYRGRLVDLGVDEGRLETTSPSIDTTVFNAGRRDMGVWGRLGVRESRRVLYVGRISAEKNLRLLAAAWRRAAAQCPDTALVLAGEGPFVAEMRQLLEGTPAYFVGRRGDDDLGAMYASADLFAFPSVTDTLGQVVMEAQCSGLAAIVSDTGGPAELVDDNLTGRVLPARAGDEVVWAQTIAALLADDATRGRLGRTAVQLSARFSLSRTFEHWWGVHAGLAQGPIENAGVIAALAEPQRV